MQKRTNNISTLIIIKHSKNPKIKYVDIINNFLQKNTLKFEVSSTSDSVNKVAGSVKSDEKCLHVYSLRLSFLLLLSH